MSEGHAITNISTCTTNVDGMFHTNVCLGTFVSTVTYLTVAAARFSWPIGSELEFSNSLAFLCPFPELLKVLSCRDYTASRKEPSNKKYH